MKNWIEQNVVPILSIIVVLVSLIIGWSYAISERVTKNEVHGYYRQKTMDKMEKKLDTVSNDINRITVAIEKIASEIEMKKEFNRKHQTQDY